MKLNTNTYVNYVFILMHNLLKNCGTASNGMITIPRRTCSGGPWRRYTQRATVLKNLYASHVARVMMVYRKL